jgi:uncharacterized protein
MPGLDVTPPLAPGRQYITAYGNGGFRVSGRAYTGSVMVLAEQTTTWSARTAEEISLASLQPVLDAAVSILIIGCGTRFMPAPAHLRGALAGCGVALEWMDTGAACRTYNVLVLEGRSVAAALIATP